MKKMIQFEPEDYTESDDGETRNGGKYIEDFFTNKEMNFYDNLDDLTEKIQKLKNIKTTLSGIVDHLESAIDLFIKENMLTDISSK